MRDPNLGTRMISRYGRSRNKVPKRHLACRSSAAAPSSLPNFDFVRLDRRRESGGHQAVILQKFLEQTPTTAA